MDALDTFTTIANAAGAATAAVLNLWVSHHAPSPWRQVRISVATLAVVISTAFAARLWIGDPSGWASMMGGVSLLVWPVVWIWPAVLTIRTMRDVERVAETFDP